MKTRNEVVKNIGKGIVSAMLFFAVFGIAYLSFGWDVKADSVEGFWRYSENSDKTTVTITEYTGDIDVVEIPSTLGGKTVTTLGDEAFAGKKYMHTVKIPATVRTIAGGYSWRNGCFGSCESLVKVEGLEYVTSIGSRAFYGCTQLADLTFGSGLTAIGDSAFENDALLPTESVSLPDSLKSIGTSAFFGCSALTSVRIPASVTSIGNGAFSDCGELASAEIYASCALESGLYSTGIFENCKKLSSVVIGPMVKGIGNNIFKNDTALLTVEFGNGLTYIGDSAFLGCILLEAADLPEGIREIGGSAFYGCTSLQELSLKPELLTIGADAFNGCSALVSVVLPNTVVKIENRAFANCSALTEVTIPNSVKNFPSVDWNCAFSGCGAITVYGYANSAAETYADNRENLTFSALDAVLCENLIPNETEIRMKKGETRRIVYTTNPENTTDAITWDSSASDIAEVNQLGEVTAKGAGDATITMLATSGIRAFVTVKVREITKVSFAVSNRTISIGETYTQTAQVEDSWGICSDVAPTYSSSNDAIATVNANGMVTGIKDGYATIYARVEDRQASYRIRVIKPSSSSNETPSGNKTGNDANKSIDKITISRKGKVLTVKTIPGASVKVKAKKSILGKSSKTATTNSKGTVKIKFKKKIKNVTVTVQVSKTGYQTKTAKKKFKK